MLALVLGGTASGKSAYAESLAVSLRKKDGGALIYLATMIPANDRETQQRIARHREMRAKKGFCTLERYSNLSNFTIPKGSTVLLECMSNLVANELFDENRTKEKPHETLISGLKQVKASVANLVVVSNDVFFDGKTYDESTMEYLKLLITMNKELTKAADSVTEVVFTIPIQRKGTVKI